jgi:formate dehydrogenase accessory protein FdhE
MAQNAWKQRVARAGELAAQYPFAAEILRFYAEIARFQSGFFERLEASANRRGGRGPSSDGPPELIELMANFPAFLSVVEKSGPAQLSQAVTALRGRLEYCSQLLSDYWSPPNPEGAGEAETGIEFFVARAFLQPYAEFVRARTDLQWTGHTESTCPFCGRKPGFGVLRALGDGGKRSLVCSFCLAEWEFRRIVCPGCGEENHSKLPVYTAADFEHIRVECCDSCQRYLKTVDLTKSGLAEPLVDEIASVPLDLWAQEHGYRKLQSNLMQL